MTGLFTDEMRRDPYPVYDQLRARSPLFHFPPRDLWMILDYEGVKRALNDHDAFSSSATASGITDRPLDWLIFANPPRHTKLRALILRAFTPRAVANLEPRIRELSRALLDQTIERGEMDLVADYSVPLPTMVIAEMIGIPLADRDRFKLWSDALLGLSETVTGSPEEAAKGAAGFGAATAEMVPYVAELTERRRSEPRDDLITRLVEAEVDGERLTPAEVVGFFQLLLLAGTETTTNLINNAVLCLLEHPGELARLKANPGLLPSAIEEVLRHRSPLQAMFRATRRDVEMHGQIIPFGKLVLPVIGSANRDPAHFADPDRFDITRDPNPHLAFGHGIHFCLGAPLARLEGRIALADLLERLPGLALASDEPWEPRKAFHVLGPSRLPIRFGGAAASGSAPSL